LRTHDHRLVQTEQISFHLFYGIQTEVHIGIQYKNRFSFGQIKADIPRPTYPGIHIVVTEFIDPGMGLEDFADFPAVKNTDHLSWYLIQIRQQGVDVIGTMGREIQNRYNKTSFYVLDVDH
jgi:hypothetical protein